MALTQILTTDSVSASVVNTKIVDPANLHLNSTTNPHAVTKTQVGLGNSDNTSDANKPISNATQTALNTKSTRHEFAAAVKTTWVGASAPYTQDVTVTGILADDDPIINPVYSATNATAILEKAAWGNVGKVETALNTITLTCFEEKPVTAFNLQLLVVR